MDSTVRIWSLDKFKQLYILHISPTDELSCVKLLNNGKKIVTAFGSQVKISAIHFILKNFLAVDTQIDEIICGFKSSFDYQQHKVSFTISVGIDNSAFIERFEEGKTDNNGNKCTLYPPPSAQKILEVKYSITLDRVIVFLSNSTLCFYNINRETALLEKI